ncbi:IS701 family transposase [Streptomyces sp. CA-132043]|uniref:IS701 family transposase n=1 Tax=Streptomyces sp. CA-132043 TaxID=3240048 RepID=UPI003D8C6AB4
MTEHHGSGPVRPVPHHPADDLARHLFQDLPRADQRRWATAYLRGLCSTPGKKSVRNMAWTVSTSDTAWQSLHQIVNASTWRWEPVRRRLADWCARQLPPRALVPAPVLIPKRGQHSVGVHRRFDPASGRTLGCQWAFGLFLATEYGTTPLDWRLHLPGRWSEDARLRTRVCVPESERSRAPHDLTLDLLDHPAAPEVPVLATAAHHTGVQPLLAALTARGHGFALRVPATTPVTIGLLRPTRHVRGPQPTGALPARQFLQRLGRAATAPLGPAAAHLRLAPAMVHVPGSPRPLQPVATWQPEDGPRHIWLTDLPAARLAALADLLTVPFAPAADSLVDHGLHDFEGRSYPGWHRHMTLVSAAHAHHVRTAATAWQQAA